MTETRHPKVIPFFDGPTPLVPLFQAFARGINPTETWWDKLRHGFRFDWRGTRDSLRMRRQDENDKYGERLTPDKRMAFAARRVEARSEIHGFEI